MENPPSSYYLVPHLSSVLLPNPSGDFYVPSIVKKHFSILGFNFYVGRSEPLDPFGAKGRAGSIFALLPFD